jgi:galactose-1-phosphate uridylyltransferase
MRDSNVEAVVYFKDEQLSVLDRTGHIESFQTSTYAKQLNLCIVYLDESHTRGTDLKLPQDYRAVVTLGAQLTKNRLTQACMRLRKLGHEQSVTFIVPEEIATKIRELTVKSVYSPITVYDVIYWSISETWQDLRRSMPL